jgi:hypothetical protein
MKLNSKDVGSLGEHIAIVELLKQGIQVSRPLGDNSRYDLILDIEGALLTCQVKSTMSSTDEWVEFWLQSSQTHRGRGKQSYSVDLFLLVGINNQKVFALEDMNRASIKIRYTKPASTNQHGFNWFEDYLLSNYLTNNF